MASFSEEDGILRIPAVSPCRRDYQLRSVSTQGSDCEDSSRPQSPWLPRSHMQQGGELMSPLRLHEAAPPIDRPNSRSGSLPVASRSYSYGGHTSPLPANCSGAGVVTSARGYRQSISFAERLPSASSEDRGSGVDDEVAGEVPYTSYLRNTRFSPSPTNLRRRNCVSGELGRSFEVAQARKCKSGEIVALEIRADGIFPIPESRKEEPRSDAVRKHRPSGSILWEALNDADNEIPSRELLSATVPVPFKWEEAASSKVSNSRTSSEQARISETGDTKLVLASSDASGSAVPFKWEVAPGKPKREEKGSIATPGTAPALQLPPRLASAASMKRNSWSSSPPPHRARSLSASLSSSVAKQLSHRSPEEPPSPSTPRAAKPRGFSGTLSQFGTPQYQSAEYSFCEDSSHRVRSPTSTLYGPGTPSSSSSSSSSRKPSVSFSHSVESFDRWSYGDHSTSTCTESQGEDSVRGHEEADQMDGAIVKLRRKLNLKSSKPPKSPMQAPSRNGYSFQGEEFFDCQAHVSSPSPSRVQNRAELLQSDTEEEVEPATRLPYKMPSPAHDMEPPSPTRGGASEFAHCLALPRFLSKGDTTSSCQWVENSSWNAPRDAPARSALEDGYRSPAYKATLDLLSPSPDLMSKKSVKLRSSSSRRRHPHLVEFLCNSLKQSLQRCTKRSVTRTHSIALYDDQFTKRHQSFMW